MVNFVDKFANYLYDSIPERDFVFTRTPAGPGSNTSQPRLRLTDPTLRTHSRSDIANNLQKNYLSLMMPAFLPSRNIPSQLG
ncbi:hypothetical protein [Hydrotalea sp.]|uniref:hypothetical protein n=1 Tax=Hydrotalea sp. TaxID=2881279 RepID=UPI0026241E2D|nr:hypothetical protein [Hydrotalea sp.]